MPRDLLGHLGQVRPEHLGVQVQQICQRRLVVLPSAVMVVGTSLIAGALVATALTGRGAHGRCFRRLVFAQHPHTRVSRPRSSPPHLVNRSRFVTIAAGLMLIVIGNVAPIGRVISVIPAPVVGGTALVVYAIVMVLGVQLLRKVDFHEQSNMVIAAVAFAAGLLPILIPGCYDQFPANVRILLGSRVAMGAFVAAFLNFLFHHLGSAGKQAADRDIIEVKHDEHHDAPVPGHPAHAAHSATGDEVTVAVASGGTKRELAEEARRRAQKVVADSPVDIVHPTATEHRRSTLARQRRGGRR